MKLLICALVLFATSAFAVHIHTRNDGDRRLDSHWTDFKRFYNKSYENAFEERARRAIFDQNMEFITQHNQRASNGKHTFTVAVNEFADMTNAEFVKIMNGWGKSSSKNQNVQVEKHEDDRVDDLPKTVDWRTKGVVTPVKNQEQCGSCWAFSAVASIEGQHALNTKKLVSLSEQNLMDCSTAEGNMGCEGGLMDQAFQYVIKNHGIDTEKSYPYKAIDEKCEYKKKDEGATITGFKDIPTFNEKALQNAAAKVGPISVAIDASQMSFQFYSSGVYNEPNCGNQRSDLDHGVTVVGYGTQNGKDYWLVKNSWGTTWGEKGYIQMSRNNNNQCGIATAASYPTGAK